MPSAASMIGKQVATADGRALGRISAVLCHPADPRVVGFEVQPDPYLYVITRRPRFVRLADVQACAGGGLALRTTRLESEAAAERDLGYSWHDTVVWRGMPVVSSEGEPVGAVHDTVYDEEIQNGSAVVRRLVISTGVFGDAALGRLEVAGDLVGGFDGEHVVVKPGYSAIRATGGAAKQAAAGAAAVKVRTGQVAAAALDAGTAAATAVGRSLRHGAGRRAIDKLRSLMGDGEG